MDRDVGGGSRLIRVDRTEWRPSGNRYIPPNTSLKVFQGRGPSKDGSEGQSRTDDPLSGALWGEIIEFSTFLDFT